MSCFFFLLSLSLFFSGCSQSSKFSFHRILTFFPCLGKNAQREIFFVGKFFFFFFFLKSRAILEKEDKRLRENSWFRLVEETYDVITLSFFHFYFYTHTRHTYTHGYLSPSAHRFLFIIPNSLKTFINGFPFILLTSPNGTLPRFDAVADDKCINIVHLSLLSAARLPRSACQQPVFSLLLLLSSILLSPLISPLIFSIFSKNLK